jgi:putative flippase GtrA
MITLPKPSSQLFFFSSVGAMAALAHLLIVLNLVHYLNFEPLLANVIAFLFAFNVSYAGHKYLTFANLAEQKQLRLPYFFAVAASAGILNEILYFFILNYTNMHYLVALTLVLGLVAVYTFVLSRFWACR